MRPMLRVIIVAAALLGAGCAHQINITPPLSTLDAKDIVRIDKVVGYYISPADLRKEVETAGGGGDKIKYLPYQESEPALRRVLDNVFAKVVSLASLDDEPFLASNKVAYVFVPTIATDSASDSLFTWPPTRFTLTLDCRALDATGATVWQATVRGQGSAEFDEFKHDFSLAARRASKDAFLRLQQQLNTARELR